jgi:hypothetical protein
MLLDSGITPHSIRIPGPMNAAIDEHCAAIGARAILVTLVRGGRARTPQSGDNSDRAAKKLVYSAESHRKPYASQTP